jgi:hypothetical protein
VALDPAVQAMKGFLDYDRGGLPALSQAQRVDYFEKRVRLVALTPMRRLLKTEIIVVDSSAILIFGVSVCCAIEATGKFLSGGSLGNADRFRAFLDCYMSPEFRTKIAGGPTYGDLLWKHFRNGLAHGFSVRHRGFEGNPGEPYFKVTKIAGHACLEINPSALLDDFEQGFERFLADLRKAAPGARIEKNFNAVFKSVFIKGN